MQMKTGKIPALLVPLCRAASVMALTLLGSLTAGAQTIVYTNDFDTDTGTNWVINTTGNGYSYADFSFDYSTVGVPMAPHTAGGTTLGLKLGANLGAGGVFPAGISVSPLDFSITENFEMRFDMWLNFNQSGQGSTEVGGAGYGTAGTSAQVAGSVDSIFVGATTDGGSSADYRVYGPDYAGSYQNDSHVIGSDPTSPLVYAAGTRNNTASYYVTNFPGQPVPEAQTNLFPRQTGLTAGDGTLAFKWHDVTLKKVGTVITYRIDGVLIGTADSTDAGALAGSDILFNFFDINTGGSTDPDATNVLFALFDNVRITTFTNIVNVFASSPDASEEGPTPGTFTITRTSADGPLTVYYSVGGTATSSMDYNALSGSATFGPTDTSVNVTVTPIDDSVSEPPETVKLTLIDGTNYNGAGSATVTIADNDTPTLSISAERPTMYERYTNDFITFRLDRIGNLNASDFDVNVDYSGAVNGTDFVGPATVTIPYGQATVDFTISPIDNSDVSGPRTVTATLTAGSGYALGTDVSASGTIVDDESPATTVLFSDPLTDSADASHWHITYGTGDPVNLSGNYKVDFGYDLATDSVPLPPGGATTALRVTCNKQVNPGAAGAVNVYYTNQAFGGDYALRFKLYLVEGSDLGYATEGVLFGINHSGSLSNWWYGSGPLTNINWSSDGIWYYVTAQPGGDGIGDFDEYTGVGGTNNNTGWQRVGNKLVSNYPAYTNVFKNNPGPFSCISGTGYQLSGVPANATPVAFEGSWADVEIKQLGKIVTMSINKSIIFAYTNTTVWTNGYLMLGYADPYGGTGGISVGASDAAAYFSDLQVVSLTPPNVSNVAVGGNNLTLTFTAVDGGDPSSTFVVESATAVTGPYTPISPPATIISMGDGTFQAVLPTSGPTRYYRLRNN